MSPLSEAKTLAVDIGGSHVKASILDSDGRMIAEELRVTTPYLPPPRVMIDLIADLTKQLPDFDRISAGFPGYVARGRVRTAPNLGTEQWRDFPLAEALAERLGKPARVLNDADVQGLGVIDGYGLECVLTLGTGIGSSLFLEGKLLPHLELGQHPVWKKKTYDQYIGDAVLKRKGAVKWNRRLRRVIAIVDTLVNFDTLHLGGGNAAAINFELPKNVKLASNSGGITGGVRLWDERLQSYFADKPLIRA
jgi:polyphosphate glucokinase